MIDAKEKHTDARIQIWLIGDRHKVLAFLTYLLTLHSSPEPIVTKRKKEFVK